VEFQRIESKQCRKEPGRQAATKDYSVTDFKAYTEMTSFNAKAQRG